MIPPSSEYSSRFSTSEQRVKEIFLIMCEPRDLVDHLDNEYDRLPRPASVFSLPFSMQSQELYIGKKRGRKP